MRIFVITIFPEIFEVYFNIGLAKKAIEKKLIEVNIVNLRDFSIDKHKKVDDYTYGGGTGMVIMFPVLKRAIDYVKNLSEKTHIILLSPSGMKFNQNLAFEYSKMESLTFVSGHYEGVDERIKHYIDEEVSIGDFITQGGEIPSLVLIDSILRLMPNFLKKGEAKFEESFTEDLLEYPQYTRPKEFDNKTIPEILLSGDHKKIRLFRKKESLKRTLLLRPDLLLKKTLDEEEKELLKEIDIELKKVLEKILWK